MKVGLFNFRRKSDLETKDVAKVNKKDDEAKKPKKGASIKKPALKTKRVQTVRERSQSSKPGRVRRLRSTAGKVSTPLKKARQTGKREYHMPLPDNKAGRVLKKRVPIAPKFVREAAQEVRLVTWPTARETVRLTIAVFIFAVVFAAIVGVLDFGLDKLFREVIID